MMLPLTVVQPGGTEPARIRRQCDGCNACCGRALLINDPDLVVFSGESCPNLCESGCAIHGPNMPATCSGYMCNYLVEPGDFTPADRPDRIGAIVRLARDRRLTPPMDRTLHINEADPGGLQNVMRNPRWRKVIRKDLLSHHPVILTAANDRLGREALIVRYHEGRIGCNLTSCHPDGNPVLQRLEPVYRNTPIHVAVTRPEQNFVFDARVLIAQLGTADQTIIGPGEASTSKTSLRFWFTRRQANALIDLLDLAGLHAPKSGPHASLLDAMSIL